MKTSGKMKTSEKILTVFVVVLTLISVYLLVQCFLFRAELKEADQMVKDQQVNIKIISFINLFIDKVLSGQTEVSFEDRLQLENAVRSINDQEIINQWQKFVNSGIDEDGQENLSKLLKLLVTKISY